MAGTTAPPRQPVASRRAGYLIAALINGAILYLVNVWPGWEAVSFISDDAHQVLGLVNFSIAAGIVANLVFLIHDAPWLKALGDLATNTIGVVVAVRIWQVFPFDFSGWSVDWSWLVRVLLFIGIAGGAIAAVVNLRKLVGYLPAGGARTGQGPHGAHG